MLDLSSQLVESRRLRSMQDREWHRTTTPGVENVTSSPEQHRNETVTVTTQDV